MTVTTETHSGASGEGTALLTVRGASKTYPGVTALKGVDLDLRPGEVHAIVGENGAGKSTLIKLLAGAETPSSGTVTMDGTTYQRLTPALALDLGIAVIYQEFTLVSTLSAADNVYLGNYLNKGPVLDSRTMRTEAARLFDRLGVDIPPNAMVEDLTTGYQQVVEIAKAISKNARLLIMDEPSAPLTAAEVEAMYGIIDTLRGEGITIVYISHRMEEIFRLSDRVTVLRDGEHVATQNTADTTRDELITQMVGRKLSSGYPQRTSAPEQNSLKVTNLSGNGVSDISFEARRGEVLGFAGLIGAGRTELMELLFGSRPATSGTVELDGRPITCRTPKQAIDRRIALVPEDRKRHGVILDFTIRDNIALPRLKQLSPRSVISRRRVAQLAETYMDKLNIKAPHAGQLVKHLSGGNQQKVVLGKWLATEPEVLIFDEPTRGIDVGARNEIYRLMNAMAEEGRTILMVSSDMEELIGMSDRIVVLREGRQQGILERQDISQEAVLSLAAEGKPE